MSRLLVPVRFQKWLPMLSYVEDCEYVRCGGKRDEIKPEFSFETMLTEFAKSSYADDEIRANVKNMIAVYHNQHSVGETIGDIDINYFGRTYEGDFTDEFDSQISYMLYQDAATKEKEKFAEWYGEYKKKH